MAKEHRAFCLYCENKMKHGIAFCPTCEHPTTWASYEERVAWEVAQWRKDEHVPDEPLVMLPAGQSWNRPTGDPSREIAAQVQSRQTPVVRLVTSPRPAPITAHQPVRPTPRPAMKPAELEPVGAPADVDAPQLGTVPDIAIQLDDSSQPAPAASLERAMEILESIERRLTSIEAKIEPRQRLLARFRQALRPIE